MVAPAAAALPCPHVYLILAFDGTVCCGPSAACLHAATEPSKTATVGGFLLSQLMAVSSSWAAAAAHQVDLSRFAGARRGAVKSGLASAAEFAKEGLGRARLVGLLASRSQQLLVLLASRARS
eukprot:SAG11_NODE_4781_length_1767_cov_21.169065_2_plen_123_part_00